MKLTVIGAGNSGLAMAAHLSAHGNRVCLWNRSASNIEIIKESGVIACTGVLNQIIPIDLVTSDISIALEYSDLILITTPANSHKDLAILFSHFLKRNSTIILNPGRTFGAIEFFETFRSNKKFPIDIQIAETQTIIYTCRKVGLNSVNIIALKNLVLLASLNYKNTISIINSLPHPIKDIFCPAKSIIETSIGNTGMILHCAPLLLNTGWTESKEHPYKYYYDGISPSIGNLLELIDQERVNVSENLGVKVETCIQWFGTAYNIHANSIYECIQKNQYYKTIDAPTSLNHRYLFEDIPCGLVPLEAVGLLLGLQMDATSLVINLANKLTNYDFRMSGRNIGMLLSSQEFLKLIQRK